LSDDVSVGFDFFLADIGLLVSFYVDFLAGDDLIGPDMIAVPAGVGFPALGLDADADEEVILIEGKFLYFNFPVAFS
jgi:hypothetical protein